MRAAPCGRMKTHLHFSCAIGLGAGFFATLVAAWAAPDIPPTIDGATFRVIRSFSGPDGRARVEHVAQNAEGTLFGVNTFGGAGDGGLVFSIGADGSNFKVLHEFTDYTRELWPLGLMLSSDG